MERNAFHVASKQTSMKKFLPFSLGAILIVTGWMTVATLYSPPARKPNSSTDRLPYDSRFIAVNIEADEKAVKIDPYAAMGWSMLASSTLAKSRESDDVTAAIRAEQAARKSLSIRKLGNISAWNKLVSSLLQQHRFHDALAECIKSEREGIYSDDTLVQHADCLIEVGRYDEAGQLIAKNPRAFGNASGWTVMSRLLDIAGKPQQAIDLLRRAVRQFDENNGASPEVLAWFHTRLAQEYLRTGRRDLAGPEFEASLRLYPRDYKALTGLMKIASQEGRWGDAIEFGLHADVIAPMADTRAAVGDAYAKLGDTTNAELMYARVVALVGRPSGISDGMHEVAPMAGTHGHRLDRQYAIFCADHNRDPDGAYAAALRDFQARHDIYAYDTLSWVCLQRGDKREAEQAINKALEHHTKDPMLLYHAGVIAKANGEVDRCRGYLKSALDIDPKFDGINAERARQMLTLNEIGSSKFNISAAQRLGVSR